MIAAWLAAWATLAAGATCTVTTSTDSNAAGTLRTCLNTANAGDTITFGQAANQFPVGTVTNITLSTTFGALPNIVDAGLVVDGDDRVGIVCAAAMTSGNGLTVVANDVQILDFEVRDCPVDGIRVTGVNVVVSGNHVHHNDQSGINVTGLSTTTSGVEVVGNDVHHNCVTPGTVACAGISVKKGTGTGTGPTTIRVEQNLAYSQASAAHGIALQAGNLHTVVGNAADDNAGAGISVAATQSGVSVTAVGVNDNLVSGNLGPGILLGTRSSFATVSGNTVESNGLGGTPAPGISVAASDDHLLEANTVTSNGAEGILVSGMVGNPASPSERLTIRGNWIGTNASGQSGLGNVGTGLMISGNGSAAVNHVVEGNTSSSNGLHGMYINAGAVTLTENVVGLGPARGAMRPNAAHGIMISAAGVDVAVDGKIAGVYRPNYVGANGGVGIASLATGVVISDNVVGWDIDEDPVGNGAEGIWIKSGTNAVVRRNRVANSGGTGIRVEKETALMSVVTPTLNANESVGNGGAGILVSGVTRAKWTENRATDNATCALSVGSTVNSGTRDSVPYVTDITGAYIEGAHLVPFGYTLDHIEVFADDGSEAGRYLGQAAIAGGGWTLTLPDTEPPLAGKRVSAVAVFTDGSSSRLEEWCGDGCPEPGAPSCRDGNDCTTDTCGGSTCTHAPTTGGVCNGVDAGCVGFSAGSTCDAGVCTPTIFASQGTDCVDENPCTDASVCDDEGHCEPDGNDVVCDDGNPCTADGECDLATGCPPATPRAVGFRCEDDDLCLQGETCDAFANCLGATDVWECPEQTACNACSCDPDLGCLCEGICGDGFCGPDDFAALPDGPDPDTLPDPCPECMVGGVFDADGDGFPNVWEASGANVDCSMATTCPGCPPGVDLKGGIDLIEGRREVFLEVDWLAPRGDGETFDPPDFAPMMEAYDRHDISLTVDVSDEVPYVDVVMPSWHTHLGETPYTGSPSWTSTRDLKRDYFDMGLRRGVYHYGIRARQFRDLETTNTGLAEGPGDDFLVTHRGFADPEAVLNTFTHEIGHNHGLSHGGTGGSNSEPNFTSVMNYEHQHLGMYVAGQPYVIGAYGRPDYSWARLRDLDIVAGFGEQDAMWTSTAPIDPEGLFLTSWACPPDPVDGYIEMWEAPPHTPNQVTLNTSHRRMDLNCDGDKLDANLHHDLKNPTAGPANRDFHAGANDWSASVDADNNGYLEEGIQFNFQQLDGFGHLGAPQGDPPEEEQTEEQARAAGVWQPPMRPEGVVFPGCTTPKIPLSGATQRIPVVLYGSVGFDPTGVGIARFHGATPDTTTVADIDGDGFDDLWLEYQLSDVTRLSSVATAVGLSGRMTDDRRLWYTSVAARLSNAPDGDEDGIHDACDACPTVGHPRGPDGCPQ